MANNGRRYAGTCGATTVNNPYHQPDPGGATLVQPCICSAKADKYACPAPEERGGPREPGQGIVEEMGHSEQAMGINGEHRLPGRAYILMR